MKIRTKLITIMIPLITISTMILSYIGIYNFITTVQNEIIDELKIIAYNLMDKVSRQMFERYADIRFLSTNNILGSQNVTLSEKMDYLRSLERASKSYASISIYDANGIKIGDTRNIFIGKNDSEADFFKEPMNGKTYYGSSPKLDESLNQLVIYFSAPIYNKNKEIQSVVVAAYPITKVNGIIKGNIISEDSLLQSKLDRFKVDLISNNATVIYSNHDRKSIMQTNQELQEITSKNKSHHNSNSDTSIQETSIQETNHFHHSPNSNMGQVSGVSGDQIFVWASQDNGYLDYGGSGWFLVLRVNTDSVFGEITYLVNQYLTVSAVILVITILIILIIANRIISVPLSKLMEKVMELSKGNYNSKIIIKTSADEISKLASTFELMRKNVNEVNHNLNTLVKKRTIELEKANGDLKANEENLKNLNKELVMADTAKEEFMSMISHELKTPIVPAKGYLEILLRYDKIGELNDKQKKYLNVIYKNLQKIEFLVNDVLDVYKLDIGKLKLKKEQAHVNELIDLVLSDSKEIMIGKNMNLNVDVKLNGDYKISCDIKRIEQVFANLIKNSLDFIPKTNGEITIRAELLKNQSMIQFSIEDNGVGIPPSEAKNLFQKFYQIDTSATRKHGGTGLGLVICKGIVQAHGGEIWVDKTFTNGACFKFTLPVLNQSIKEMVNNKRKLIESHQKKP